MRLVFEHDFKGGVHCNGIIVSFGLDVAML